MHTLVEVGRALARILDGDPLTEARRQFGEHWKRMAIVELDQKTCRRAAELAEQTGARTLDALHLAAADRAGGGALSFATFDVRQAEAARSLGWTVVGT
jgi:predicted nucleic acid-binding protein